ncbi:hypothetical protein [Flavobacterium sp. TSSA_36]|uniref:hypothetical protein n=1 Tax=Flavobacterium sp. TSSA_36 TaxID=3447669 RepID=UPI003F3904CB
MSQIKNYIQYIDEFQNLKVMPILASYDGSGELQYYFLKESIKIEYFILSVYLENKRVDSVDFKNCDSLFMLSFINDVATVDLSLINRNEYFAPSFNPQIIVAPKLVSSSSVVFPSYNGSLETAKKHLFPITDKYGIVFPLIITSGNPTYDGSSFPYDINVKTLEVFSEGYNNANINYILPISYDGYMSNYGSTYHTSQVFDNVFSIDDIRIKIFVNTDISYNFNVTVYPNYNAVFFDCTIPIISVEENHNNSSTVRIECNDGNGNYVLFGLDWKRFPTLYGS